MNNSGAVPCMNSCCTNKDSAWKGSLDAGSRPGSDSSRNKEKDGTRGKIARFNVYVLYGEGGEQNRGEHPRLVPRE
jgi:hypothetical protein